MDEINIESTNLEEWFEKLDHVALEIWREAMAQLRQLHGDVWNGVRFFLTVNGIIIAAIFAIARAQSPGLLNWVSIALLSLIGICTTIIAIGILSKHRDYYLDMLLRKTLIEIKLDFYGNHISDIDFSFPWSVDKEFIGCLVSNPKVWLRDQKTRKGTISRRLFLVYKGVMGIYVLAFLAAIAGLV